MSASEIAFLTVSVVFLAASTVTIVLGLLFDFWLERRHRSKTGQPLTELVVPFPMLTGFYCGMWLIAPNLSISREFRTSIRLAERAIQWAARVNAVAVPVTATAGIATWLLMPD